MTQETPEIKPPSKTALPRQLRRIFQKHKQTSLVDIANAGAEVWHDEREDGKRQLAMQFRLRALRDGLAAMEKGKLVKEPEIIEAVVIEETPPEPEPAPPPPPPKPKPQPKTTALEDNAMMALFDQMGGEDEPEAALAAPPAEAPKDPNAIISAEEALARIEAQERAEAEAAKAAEGLDDLAASMDALNAPEESAEEDDSGDDLAALMDSMSGDAPAEKPAEPAAGLDDLAATMDALNASEQNAEDDGSGDDLAALMDSMSGDAPAEKPAEPAAGLDDLAATMDALNAPEENAEDDGSGDDLAALMDSMSGDAPAEKPAEPAAGLDDLAATMDALNTPEETLEIDDTVEVDASILSSAAAGASADEMDAMLEDTSVEVPDENSLTEETEVPPSTESADSAPAGVIAEDNGDDIVLEERHGSVSENAEALAEIPEESSAAGDLTEEPAPDELASAPLSDDAIATVTEETVPAEAEGVEALLPDEPELDAPLDIADDVDISTEQETTADIEDTSESEIFADEAADALEEAVNFDMSDALSVEAEETTIETNEGQADVELTGPELDGAIADDDIDAEQFSDADVSAASDEEAVTEVSADASEPSKTDESTQTRPEADDHTDQPEDIEVGNNASDEMNAFEQDVERTSIPDEQMPEAEPGTIEDEAELPEPELTSARPQDDEISAAIDDAPFFDEEPVAEDHADSTPLDATEVAIDAEERPLAEADPLAPTPEEDTTATSTEEPNDEAAHPETATAHEFPTISPEEEEFDSRLADLVRKVEAKRKSREASTTRVKFTDARSTASEDDGPKDDFLDFMSAPTPNDRKSLRGEVKTPKPQDPAEGSVDVESEPAPSDDADFSDFMSGGRKSAPTGGIPGAAGLDPKDVD